jgi:hypothetical protein
LRLFALFYGFSVSFGIRNDRLLWWRFLA